MANEQDLAKRIVALEQEVSELRHIVAAIANTSGKGDEIAAAVKASQRKEQLKHEQERAEAIERAKALGTL